MKTFDTQVGTTVGGTPSLARSSFTPSKSYRWCVIAFNPGSGLDFIARVHWFTTRKVAEAYGEHRFGAGRHIIGRAPF